MCWSSGGANKLLEAMKEFDKYFFSSEPQYTPNLRSLYDLSK